VGPLPHSRFDGPMVPSRKTALGDKGKAVGTAPTALLFERGRRSAAKLLSEDEARRIAANKTLLT
jgi:hypothetical protein